MVTKNEFILNAFISVLKIFRILKHLNWNNYLIIILSSFNFIQIIVSRVSDLHMSIKIKYNHLNTAIISNCCQIIANFFTTYLINLFENIIYITSILWTREIYFRNFYF